MIKQDGFALVAVLLLSSVLMLLTLSQWQALILFQKMTQQRIEQAEYLACFEKALQQIMGIETEQEGVVGCKGHKLKYAVVAKGKFPCICREINGDLYSTVHLQMNIWSMAHPASHLEVRVAKPIPLMPCLNKKIHVVNATVLSWKMEF